MFGRQRLDLEHVRGRAGQLAVPQGLRQCSVINTSAAGGAYQHRPRRIDESASFPIRWRVSAVSGIVLSAEEAIAAVCIDEAQASRLNIGKGAPLLQVERLAFDIMGRPIERRLSLYRTDHLGYRVTLD